MFSSAERLKVSISQSEAKDADSWKSKPLKVFADRRTWSQKLSKIESRSDTASPDEALLAIHAGSRVANQQESGYVLCEPRVYAYIELTPRQSLHLRCGQRVSVYLQSNKPTLGSLLLSRISSYVFD
jgi:hypothetical protein